MAWRWAVSHLESHCATRRIVFQQGWDPWGCLEGQLICIAILLGSGAEGILALFTAPFQLDILVVTIEIVFVKRKGGIAAIEKQEVNRNTEERPIVG